MSIDITEDLISQARKVLKKYLKDKGYRLTVTRFEVMEQIFRHSGHVDVIGLQKRMKEQNIYMSKGTIYNTLVLLVDCGLVMQHQFSPSHAVYERAYGYRQHDHIICKRCGKIIEFCDPRIQEIKLMAEQYYKLTIEDHALYLYGKCKDEDCIKNNASP